MEPEFWRNRWKQNQIGFHLGETNPQLKRFWSNLAVSPPGRVLVPMCGKTLDMVWLAAQGWDVLGVELSSIAVAAFFSERQLNVTRTHVDEFEVWQAGPIEIYCGDFFALRPHHTDQVRAIYDRAALIALPPEKRAHYVEHLRNLLPKAPPGLLVSLEYPQHEMDGPPFCVDENEIRRLYEATYQITRVHQEDALEPTSHFRDKGVTKMTEVVYELRGRHRE